MVTFFPELAEGLFREVEDFFEEVQGCFSESQIVSLRE
jgi:hypothetical protein